MAKKLKRIGVMSLGKMFGALYALMGLIIGAFISLFSSIGQQSASLTSTIFGAGSIIILPIFYGILGFIFGIISAALYNLIALWIGGIELEIE